MATKKIYSIDDILDEYSVDSKNQDPVSDVSKTRSKPDAKHSIPDISDIIPDEYSLENIIGDSDDSDDISSPQEDIIDISLIQIQDEPNNPETPEIISDIVNYFKTDKTNEEKKFETIKQSIQRAGNASEISSDSAGNIEATVSTRAQKILNQAKKNNRYLVSENAGSDMIPACESLTKDNFELHTAIKDKIENSTSKKISGETENTYDNKTQEHTTEQKTKKEITDKQTDGFHSNAKPFHIAKNPEIREEPDDFSRFSFVQDKSPLSTDDDSEKTISEIHNKIVSDSEDSHDTEKNKKSEKKHSVSDIIPDKIITDDKPEKSEHSVRPDLKYHLKNRPPENQAINNPIIPDKPSPLSFKSYRSATRIQDSPNRIVKNPEDNIRYVRKVNDNVQSSPTPPRVTKKRKAEQIPQTKSDIQDLEISETKKDKKLIGDIFNNKISEFKSNFLSNKHKTVSNKKPAISIKSIPEVDFFSIDVEINNPQEKSKAKFKNKTGQFIKNINNNFSHSSENHLDDYNAPKDASLILDDLYDLKRNLTVKFAIQLTALIITLYLSAASLYNLPLFDSVKPSVSPHAYGFIMFLLSASVLFTSFPVITNGLRNIFRKKADCDSLVAVLMTFSTIASAIIIENASMISSNSIYVFTPVAISAFLVNTLGKHLIVNRAINNFNMLISSKDKYALTYIDDEAEAEQLTKGVINDYPILAAMHKTGFASDFLKYTYSADIADKICKKVVPFSLIFSVIVTAISVFWYRKTMDTVSFAFISSVFSLCLSAFGCLGIPLVVNLPLAGAASEAEDNESIILGYQSIDDFYDTNSVIIDASQIFPEHSIKLSAIKMFSDTKIDDAIIAAASIVKSSGSIFTGMFNKIIDNDDSLIEHVENYSYEEYMGICGWIHNKRILFGNRQLMVNHNIEGMPPKSKEKDLIGKGKTAMYLSISGNLAAMFVIKIKADPKVTENLNALINSGISLIVKSIDPVTTVTRISRLFDIPEDMVRIIPAQYHKFCDKVMAPVSRSSASVLCSGTLSSISKAISNTKYIHNSTLTGLVLQSTSAIISIFIILAFLFLGVLNQITPLMLVFYHTVWMLITLLVMKIKP